MSPAALHLKWPLGHVGEEEAHIAVPLPQPLGPRCRFRIRVRCLCLEVSWEVVVALPLPVWQLGDQPLAHPQSRYLVCTGVEFKDLWVPLVCRGL